MHMCSESRVNWEEEILSIFFFIFCQNINAKAFNSLQKRKLQNYFDFAKPQRPNRRLFLRLLGIPYTEMNVNGC